MTRMEAERIDCSRAQFAEMFGERPSPDVIGVCLCNTDGTIVLKEYVFTDPPSVEDYRRAQQRRAALQAMLHMPCLPATKLSQLAELERLYKL